MIQNPNDREMLRILSMLCAKAFEVVESVDNTHGFVIDLDKSGIQEMDFDEITAAISDS